MLPNHNVRWVEFEFGCEATDQLLELVSSDFSFRRDNPMPNAILTAKPDRIVTRIIEIGETTADQNDPIIVVAIADVLKRPLQSAATCPDAL